MPSLKAYIFTWIIWWRRKGIFQSAEGMRKAIEVDRETKDYRPPAYLQQQLIIEERHVSGCVVYEVAAKSESPNRARVLYLHGGAWVLEIAPFHWKMIATLAERLKAVVTVAIYPMGPEHTLMEIYDAVQPLYDELALPSQDNTPFFAIGDSAGATMALALSQRALKADRPVASRLVLISPVVDLTYRNPETRALAKLDPWLDIPGLDEVGRMVCPDMAIDDPRASLINGNLDQLPPMMVFAGTLDMATPDTKLFVAKAREKGRVVEYVEGEGMMHIWPLLPIPEAKEAIDTMARWLERAKP